MRSYTTAASSRAAQELAPKVYAANLSALTVKIWENDIAWASHRLLLPLS